MGGGWSSIGGYVKICHVDSLHSSEPGEHCRTVEVCSFVSAEANQHKIMHFLHDGLR